MAVRPRLQATTIPELEALLSGLAAQSLVQMNDPATFGAIPPLYSGHVRYLRETPGHEDWQSAVVTAQRGTGDCEDLVVYRVAELRKQGIDARPKVTWINPRLRHVTLTYPGPNGSLIHEDPSKRLGM